MKVDCFMMAHTCPPSGAFIEVKQEDGSRSLYRDHCCVRSIKQYKIVNCIKQCKITEQCKATKQQSGIKAMESSVKTG